MKNGNIKSNHHYCPTSKSKPNIIIILADDLGFSDIGCFGSEISTPNIDSLAYGDSKSDSRGVRFTQMYNCARCCPSRASLLTGKYPHQAGIGHMVYDAGIGPEYQGYLRNDVPTIAELMKSGGYRTYMSGKWHVGGEYPPDATHEWIQNTMGDESHPIPTQRGFDEFYGTLGGGGSYYQPPSLVRNEKVIEEVMPEFYYYTDAINDEACRMIESACASDDNEPFFLYVAHVAPHWPLHAPKEQIEKYKGTYRKGWDNIRKDRHQRLIDQKLISPDWPCSPRDEHSPPWDEVSDSDWEDMRMATYAAQVTIMDEGIGRILETLQSTGSSSNTVIFFLSDNGGCAEYLKENGEEGQWPEFYGGHTRDGRQIKVGNLKGVQPGGEDTFMSYDLPWANVSNSPFRLFKSWVHEGGISMPFIVNLPPNMKLACNEENNSDIHHDPWSIMDIVATCCELGGISVCADLEGESFLPVFHGHGCKRKQPIFWEHQGNCAARIGRWKLVYRRCDDEEIGWELYDMETDRTELNNLISLHEEKSLEMINMWKQWANRCGVKPWPLHAIPEGEKDWSNLPWLW